MKTKCPHPGLRDLRGHEEANVAATGSKHKRAPKRLARADVERGAARGKAPAMEATYPPDDIEREADPGAAQLERDIERE